MTWHYNKKKVLTLFACYQLAYLVLHNWSFPDTVRAFSLLRVAYH